MKGAIEIKGWQLVALIAIVGVAVWAVAAPTSFEEVTGISIGEYIQQDTGTTDTTDTTQNQATDTQTDTQTTSQATEISYQVATVNLYLKDKLNPKAGIPGIEVEVLEAPSPPYTYADLIGIASDPMRDVIDEDTSTSSAGLAAFTGNRIFVNRDYIYSIRGDTNVYDKVLVKKIPLPATEFSISAYTFPGAVYDYYVGAFETIQQSTSGTYNCTDDSALNITGKTGMQYVEFTVVLGQSETGNATKDTVIVFRSPEGYELESGDINSLYLVRESGTQFNIPSTNLVDYIDTAPISLGGSIYDTDFGSYMMTVADSGNYTVKLTYDADQIEPSTDRLQICIDDLGDYRAKDDVTKSVKAAASCVTVEWCGT